MEIESKGGLVVKENECHDAELNSIPTYSRKLLSNAGLITSTDLFTYRHLMFLIIRVPPKKIQGLIPKKY